MCHSGHLSFRCLLLPAFCFADLSWYTALRTTIFLPEVLRKQKENTDTHAIVFKKYQNMYNQLASIMHLIFAFFKSLIRKGWDARLLLLGCMIALRFLPCCAFQLKLLFHSLLPRLCSFLLPLSISSHSRTKKKKFFCFCFVWCLQLRRFCLLFCLKKEVPLLLFLSVG